MAPLPGDRNYGGQRNDPYRSRRDEEPRWGDDRARREAGDHPGARRPIAGYWDARDEERMHRAQADFDYEGRGRWDEQLGGYRYTERNYPEERYAARSGQGRDFGPRRDAARRGAGYAGERYRPQWGEETTGRGYAGEIGQDHRPAGEFRGRGPAGYRRSDERIREDVNDCLTDDPYLDAGGIQVNVQNCEVTLDGTVNTRACKRRAENLVEEISGVTHVQNNLRVQGAEKSETSTTRSDGGKTTA